MDARVQADIWHESFIAARPPCCEARRTEIGAQALASIKQAITVSAARSNRATIVAPSFAWAELPELYRKMIARGAGLSGDVVRKLDRELTETEKVMMRSFLADFRLHIDSLVSL